MNRIYRLIWNDCRQAWLPVAETARSRGKRSTRAKRLVAAAMAALVAWTPAAAYAAAPAPNALPAGGQVAAGAARIAQSGSNMTINQSSNRAVLNWQSFNIGANASVQFQQPGASAVALNRVVGADPSAIYGRLSANGQVFLVNPSGVLFGQGARVDVGGLVATTMSIRDSDFMNGNYRFTRSGSRAAVVNQGEINAQYVALMAPEVRNEGTISARMGTVVLAAGEAASLSITGQRLVGVQVDKAEIDTLVENKHLIRAEGGTVILSAQSAADLLGRVVNSGAVEANGITAGGGTIRLSASHAIEHSGSLSANAGANGNGGTILAIADLANPASRTSVSGSLSARGGAESGDGGFIETSASRLRIEDSARVDTRAPNGRAGEWLLDPTDFTVAASGGDITGATLSANLTGNVTIESGTGANGTNGDVFINDGVTWTTGSTLIVRAHRHIDINSTINVDGSGTLQLEYGQGAVAGGNTSEYRVRAPVNLSATAGFKTLFGSDGTLQTYTVVRDATALANIANDLAGKYVLGTNISGLTNPWAPLGDGQTTVFSGVLDGLGHTVDGLTRANTANSERVGLFGSIASAGVVQNVGVTNVNVAGIRSVGALAGENKGTIRSSYATGTVTGSDVVGSTTDDLVNAIGGLVGRNQGRISGSYSAANVTATSGDQSTGGGIGGLVGIHENDNINSSSIKNSYASGSVTGGNNVGGLVGTANGGSVPAGTLTETRIEASHARGAVTGTTNVGGLIGATDVASVTLPNVTGLQLANNFWDKTSTGQANSAGEAGGAVTGMTTAQMKIPANFTSATADNGNVNPGWNTANTWKIQNGFYPVLLSYPNADGTTTTTTIFIRLTNNSSVYGDTPVFNLGYFTTAGGTTAITDANPGGTAVWNNAPTSASNPNNYSLSYASGITLGNATYTLSAGDAVTWTVNLRPITVTVTPGQNKVYNGQGGADPALTHSVTSTNQLVNSDALSGSLTRAPGSDVGTSYAIGQGTLANAKYTVTFVPADFAITPAELTLAGSRKYDGTTAVAGGALTATGANGEKFAVSGEGASGNLASANASATAQTLQNLTGLTLGTSTNGGLAGNYNALGFNGSQVTINKADLTLDVRRVYDGTTKVAGIAVNARGVNGEKFNLTGLGDTSNLFSKNVGENSTLVSVTGLTLGPDNGAALASNYNALSRIGSSVIIERKELSFVLEGGRERQIVYGNDVVFDLSRSFGSLPGENVSFSVPAAILAGIKNVGEYTISNANNQLVQGTDRNNYYGSAPLNTIRVVPRPLDIAVSKEYDGTADFSSGFALSGTVNGDAVPTVTSGSASASSPNAALYSNFAANSLKLSNANYTVGSGSVSATIAPKEVDVLITTTEKNGVFMSLNGTIGAGRPTSANGNGGPILLSGQFAIELQFGEANAPVASGTLVGITPAVTFTVGKLGLIGNGPFTIGVTNDSGSFKRNSAGQNANLSDLRLDGYLNNPNYRIKGGTFKVADSTTGLGLFNGTLFFPDVGSSNATQALATTGIASVSTRAFDSAAFSLSSDLITEEGGEDADTSTTATAAGNTGRSNTDNSGSNSLASKKMIDDKSGGSGDSSSASASDDAPGAGSAEGDAGEGGNGKGKSKTKGKGSARGGKA